MLNGRLKNTPNLVCNLSVYSESMPLSCSSEVLGGYLYRGCICLNFFRLSGEGGVHAEHSLPVKLRKLIAQHRRYIAMLKKADGKNRT